MDFQLEEGIAILERTPGVLRALLNGLPDRWTPPPVIGPGPIGVQEGVRRLINGEHAFWIPRARIILAQGGNPPLEPYRGEIRGKSLSGLLDEFAHLRQESLATLRSWNLSERELALAGEFPGLGPFTLRQFLANWVVTDLNHISLTARTMAGQYQDAVGPFRRDNQVRDRKA